MKKQEKRAKKIADLEQQIAVLKAARDRILALESEIKTPQAKKKSAGTRSPSRRTQVASPAPTSEGTQDAAQAPEAGSIEAVPNPSNPPPIE